MAGIEVQLDGEQVTEQVHRAIMESVIGDELRKAIQKALDSTKSFSGENVVAQIVNEQMRLAVMKLVNDEYADRIEAAAREALSAEAVSEIATRAVKALVERPR